MRWASRPFWFCLIGVLWSGYFLLEGFDFGVGMLLPVLPRDERERSMMFESIGPVWDGNEVWLVVAAGATFAAFPAWYATMFSGFYIALLLILVLLIVRVVSFEWREKRDSPRWRTMWLWANTIGSVGAPFLWGVALANLVHGVPLNSSHGFSGDFFDLFSAYTVVAGLAVVVAVRAARRDLPDRCGRSATSASGRPRPPGACRCPPRSWASGSSPGRSLVAHNRNSRGILPTAVPAALTAIVLILAVVLTRTRRSGWAFTATGARARSASSRRSSPACIRGCSSRTRRSPTASRSPTPRPATTRSR